jgi:hypothetical protein
MEIVEVILEALIIPHKRPTQMKQIVFNTKIK